MLTVNFASKGEEKHLFYMNNETGIEHFTVTLLS